MMNIPPRVPKGTVTMIIILRTLEKLLSSDSKDSCSQKTLKVKNTHLGRVKATSKPKSL
jgi:hypothetical protein